MASPAIPSWIVEFLLLGKSQSEQNHRFMQDGGVVTDVWLAFALDLTAPARVLLTPTDRTTTADMAFELHQCLKEYRAEKSRHAPYKAIAKRVPTSVAPLDNFVAATIYVDELLRVVMPLTRWWSENGLAQKQAIDAEAVPVAERLADEIRRRIGIIPANAKPVETTPVRAASAELAKQDFQISAATPIAALIGAIRLAFVAPTDMPSLPAPVENAAQIYADWIAKNANRIAQSAVDEFSQPLTNRLGLAKANRHDPGQELLDPGDRLAPALIHRVFRDRDAAVSNYQEALAATKADAATRVFDVSCKAITWAIIDSGIASTHAAFLDWAEVTKAGLTEQADTADVLAKYTRVRATYDFTLITRIRNYELSDPEPGSNQQKKVINALIAELEKLPGKVSSPTWKIRAQECLRDIAAQLRQRLIPDWRLIEPLIKIGPNDGAGLTSDHGTHVAGTLGADWRVAGKTMMKGVCPDITLYDLRVIPAPDMVSDALTATEFAVIAATEFVQFLNREAGTSGPVIHGVNISMSIPHKVSVYGSGATPICVACDRLVSDGVVVVAAAGNRGWKEEEAKFGNFVFCSITDPGNAYHVITVGATHRSAPHTYGVSYFSSRGPTGDGRVKPDLVAPGEKIRGPVRGDTYADMDGTSMAAPFVSGAAAMLLARNREFIRNPKKVKEILCESATDLGRDRYFQGHGMLDILRALQHN